MLVATVTTTMANTVVNVPMTSILADLDAPLSRGVLVATAFPVTLAALMPVSGWLGDRFGHRRVLCWAMTGVLVGSAGAALAPSLPVLVAFRMVQGLAAAPVLPVVMVLVVQVLGEERRGRALSLWAAANGAGQALGPTTGGLLAEFLGWRAVFWQIVPLSALVVLGGRLLLPAPAAAAASAARTRLDWRGALTVTGGAALLLTATSAVPSQGVGSPAVWGLAGGGVLCLAAFLWVERGRPGAFLRPRHLVEVRYLRSSFAAAAQMYALGATLLAAPVYLVGTHGLPEGTTGLVVLALPLAMASLAPVAGRATERFGGRAAMRGGLLTLLAGLGALAAVAGWRGTAVPLVAALLALGAGVAFVQTPAATGASRSRAGRTGAGLGLFNLVRFGATALGTASVALLGTEPERLVWVFGTGAALAAAAFAFSFAGRDPQPDAATAPARRDGDRPHAPARTR
ncbi:MFS transporter [Streptomyces sp. WMMC500]|uniref:MFS transporter n=1 Tax=Streptomyces sp. WMMC500 TaxID=3015154 RepID=UPI00248C3E89|nr:MFS transporter [Streptomyces sp. WMMC500]WBB58335.1 MFS transporter [Streptomyces sp. WMMC500]